MRFLCFLLLTIAASWQMYFAVQEQLLSSENTTFLKSQKVRDSRILTYQAKQKHLFEADLTSAEILLQNALKVNSYYLPAWLGLVELYNDQGKKEQARRVMDYAEELTQGIARWRWEKALVAYQTGMVDILPDELNYIIGKIPGKNRNDALQLAFSFWQDPETLLQNVGIHNLIHLLNYSVRQKLSDQALYFWQKIENNGVQWKEIEGLNFINMLMSTGKVSEAATIWRTHFNTEHLLYNGNFNRKIIQRAFGWRNAKDKGFVMRLAPDQENNSSNVVEFRFKGWENIKFHHLTQIVPLQSGRRYKLSAEMRSKKLTTDQRPFWQVYGYKCDAANKKSEMVATDQDWLNYTIEFGVPLDCSAMVVRLRRLESRHLDNKISGKLWLKNLAISEMGEEYFILDESSQ